MAEEEDSEWLSSKIKGFTFADDDETPFEELAKYQSQTFSRSSGGQDELVISFDNENSFSVSGSSSTASRIVSDRVRAASAAYAAHLDRVERGGPSISDVVGDSHGDVIFSNDPKTLRAELTQARRAAEKISSARFTPLHPKETVRNIFLGKPFSLEFYKSWSDKLALVDEALLLGDGNAILATTLFLRQTLSRQKFLEVLTTRPSAVRHFVSYLTSRSELSELIDILSGLGRYNEAGLLIYKQALAATNGGNYDARAQRLKIITSQLHNHSDLAHVKEHVHLLEGISPVSNADLKNPEIVAKLQQPGVPSLDFDQATVMKTLLYCAYHHWKEPENLLHSPLRVKKFHKLTERQFTWVSLLARAKRYQWRDCEELVITKSWLAPLGGKNKATVNPERVVQILYDNGAPGEALQVFLTMIEDLEDREVLAKKVGAHSVVIDIYVAQRDRTALQNYKSKLVPNSREWLYAENAISVSNTRWKN